MPEVGHCFWAPVYSLQWPHNERSGVSNHQRLHCLLNCWFRRRSKKTSKLRVTFVTGEFPALRPVTRKMLPLDDVIMLWVTFCLHPLSPGGNLNCVMSNTYFDDLDFAILTRPDVTKCQVRSRGSSSFIYSSDGTTTHQGKSFSISCKAIGMH